MEGEEKVQMRMQAVVAAREAESMTAGFRIVNKFNAQQRRLAPEKAEPEIHFREVWPHLTDARWKELNQMALREDLFRSRANLIEQCKSEPLLDAALKLVNHNATFGRSPRDEFYIDPSELLAGMPPDQVEAALARSRRLLDDACNVAMAALNYPQVTRTYEEELERFKRDNPGFSEQSYVLAERRGMVSMR